jgi:glycosyltransferase involved in cell wall biosynthesis
MCATSLNASPAFSILVPVHNAGGFLRLAVQSVLSQTCSEFELIVIDDGSTDGCLDSLAGVENDARIRILRQSGKEAPGALNAGLEIARGEWIALLDHDDLWLPEKLAAHRDAIAAYPGLDLTFDWSRAVDPAGEDLGLGTRRWHGTISFEELLEDFVIGNSSAMVIRRAAIGEAGGFNHALPRLYDLDLCLRVAALRAGSCRAVPRCLTLYRRHGSQMTKNWLDLQGEWARFLRAAPTYTRRPGRHLLRIADANMHRYLAWLACESGHYRSGLGLMATAVGRAPLRSVLDARNWMIAAAAAGGLVLPPPLYRRALALGKRVSGRDPASVKNARIVAQTSRTCASVIRGAIGKERNSLAQRSATGNDPGG